MLAIEFADGREIKDTPANMECPCCHKISALRSRGTRWKCSSCGKQFLKIRRRKPIKLGDRPPCPECGNQFPMSNGKGWNGEPRYVCLKCGRYYTEMSSLKMIRNQVEVPMEVEIE